MKVEVFADADSVAKNAAVIIAAEARAATASLVPGDPVLNVSDVDVAITGVYQKRRRMTLTYSIINRARRVLWLVTGKNKAEMVCRLRDGDTSIPAGRVQKDRALLLTDRAATDPDYRAVK